MILVQKAVENERGSFDVLTEQGLIAAVIVKNAALGWRVMSRTQRKNGRTHSATPEQAAQKYFGRKLSFYYRAVQS
jgi:hypothetical protein